MWLGRILRNQNRRGINPLWSDIPVVMQYEYGFLLHVAVELSWQTSNLEHKQKHNSYSTHWKIVTNQRQLYNDINNDFILPLTFLGSSILTRVSITSGLIRLGKSGTYENYMGGIACVIIIITTTFCITIIIAVIIIRLPCVCDRYSTEYVENILPVVLFIAVYYCCSNKLWIWFKLENWEYIR